MQQVYNISENNVYKVTFDLVDEDGSAITLASLDTFYLTLYYFNTEKTTADKYHLAIINNRLNQPILNNNNVTVSATGNVTWYLQANDSAKLNSDTEEEFHVATFFWSWSGLQASQSLLFRIRKVEYAR